MNVYFAGMTKAVEGLHHSLHSYWYCRKNLRPILAQKELGTKVFLDSGAFTAFTKGEAVDVEAFIAYIEATPVDTFHVVAALDVIGDAEATWINYELMRRTVPAAIPTFHYGEDYSFLERMIAETEYLALGGVAQLQSVAAITAWFDEVWSKYLTDADALPKVKVHGFAVTGMGVITRYPWASVDSTSAAILARYGTCMLFLNNKMFQLKFSAGSRANASRGEHYDGLPEVQKACVDTELARCGVTADGCAEDFAERFVVNMRFYEGLSALAPSRFTRLEETLF